MSNILIIFFVCAGIFFFLGTTMGILRFPDFYTRMHAAGKGDTLSTMLILIGLAIYTYQEMPHFPEVLTIFKILVICGFIYVGSPTATSAIIESGYRMGTPFWKKDVPKKSSEDAK